MEEGETMMDVVFNKGAEASIPKNNPVFCFDHDFSIGDIRHSPDCMQTKLDALIDCITPNSTIRIWYSEKPQEYCGMCWLIYELNQQMKEVPNLTSILLPNQVEINQTLVQYNGWHEVNPELFSSFLSLEKTMIPAFIKSTTSKWEAMKSQNSPLRAIINGTLQSVPEDFYDPFILKELEQMEYDFSQAQLIGNVLGKYELGISDSWIQLRIEAIVNK